MTGSPPGAGRRLLSDKRIYIAVFLIGAWIVGSVVARPFYDRLNNNDDDDDEPQGGAQGQNFVELTPLVAASTRIVIATLEGDAPPASGDSVTASRRRYVIVEALRGPGQPGEALEVWGDPGPGVDGRLAVEPGTDYVLFLVERVAEGATQWTAPGEPSTAEIEEDGTLAFVVSNRYAADMLRIGWTTGTQRVPFTATLPQVRTLAATP